MDRVQLVNETAVLHRELGPSVLVAKCYELLGEDEDATNAAGEIAKREFTDLTEMARRGFPLSHISEQILRTIYVLELSSQYQQAQLVLRSFRSAVRGHISAGTLTDRLIAIRLAVAHILLRDTSPELVELVHGDSCEAALVAAWASRDAATLSNMLEQLTQYIEREEVDGGLAPSQDGWTYILEKRLRAAINNRES